MTVQRVEPASLNKLAENMRNQPWHSPDVEAIQPDSLPLARAAVANLNECARTLGEYQALAQAESSRLAEMFVSAATAYQEVDSRYGEALDDPDRRTAIDDIVIAAPTTQLPPMPDGPAALESLTADDYSDVEQTQNLLSAGDAGNSLAAMKIHANLASQFTDGHAFDKQPTNWEGDAADAAFTRLNSFDEWLHQLSASWLRLGAAAQKIQSAHLLASAQHTVIYAQYVNLKAQLVALAKASGAGSSVAAQDEIRKVQNAMTGLQRDSDQLRREYANNASFDPVRVSEPPFGAPSGGNGTVAAGSGGGSAGAGGSGAGGGQPAASPMSTGSRPAAAGGTPRSGSPSKEGSPSGGGSPSGSGSPSGGSPAGGGSPSTGPSTTPGGPATDLPTLPDDPGLHPAAAAAGGGAGGGSGGGAGGGAGPMPLQPNVGGVAVGPATAGGGAAGGAPAGAGPGGGAAGGMGGMPMGGHGQGQGGGKERRRTPGLSPDEDLYIEERPWTEAVIGNRRRRDVADTKDSK